MDNCSINPRHRYALTLKDINQRRRPNLARIIKENRAVWLLGDLPDRRHDTGEPILVAVHEDYTPKDFPTTKSRTNPRLTQAIRFIISEFGEGATKDKIKEFPVPYMAAERLANILLYDTIFTKDVRYERAMMDESKLRTEITDLQARLEEAHGESKGGRPCKYKLDDIKTVVQLKQQGVSIRKTAKRLGMAPSTVQKLLAKAKKMQLLDDLLPATKE